MHWATAVPHAQLQLQAHGFMSPRQARHHAHNLRHQTMGYSKNFIFLIPHRAWEISLLARVGSPGSGR